MKYDLGSATKFGDAIKSMLSQKASGLLHKYKEYSRSSLFNNKVNTNDANKETDTSSS